MDFLNPGQVIRAIIFKLFIKIYIFGRSFGGINQFCGFYRRLCEIIVKSKPLYLTLLVPILIIAYPLINLGSIVNGDFPYGDTLYTVHAFPWMWSENGSFNNFDIVARFPIIGILYFFSVLGVSPDILSKSMVILGFSLASFSFYFSFVHFFKSKINFDSDNMKLKIAAILGALFYAYNVWSFNRVGHWYLWIGYSMLPIFIASVIFSFRYGLKWKYLLAALTTWTFASSTPHMVVFYGLIFIMIALYYFISNARKKQNLIAEGKLLLIIVTLYLLINAYWVLPYILSSSTLTVAPSTIITEESTTLLTRNSAPLNVIRLTQGWWQIGERDNGPPQTTYLYPIWLFTSFLFPILVFLSLVIVKKNLKYVLLLLSLAIVGIFLTVGAQGQISKYFYSLLLFHIPLISQINWVFRDPDKWAFLIAVGYSFSIGIISFEILKLIQTKNFKRLGFAAFLIIVPGSLLIYSYPVYITTFYEIFNPIVLPNNIFNSLNNYISKNINAEKIFYMPNYVGTTGWRQGHLIQGFPQIESAKPTINFVSLNLKNYYNYLVNSIMSNMTMNIKNFILPLGSPYFIYETDPMDAKNIDLINKLTAMKDVKNISNIGFFKILKVFDENKTIGEVSVPKQNLVIAGGGLDKLLALNSIESFSSLNSSLVFLDQYITKEKYKQTINSADSLVVGGNVYDLALSFVDNKYVIKPSYEVYNHNPGNMWSKTATNDPLQGPFHEYINALGIDNWDFDYGKGLVLTWSRDKLHIPFEVEKNGNYDLFLRYLKNQQGGAINISIDNKTLKDIITKDQLNRFKWERAGTLDLKQGRHYLTLENIDGLNAVNIFAAIPTDETQRLLDDAYLLTNKTRDIHTLQPEIDFYTSGRYNGINYLFNANVNSTYNETFTGQITVPQKTDLMSLEFLAKKRHSNEISSYTIKDLKLIPTFEKNLIFKSDFENVTNTWINHDKSNLFTTTHSQNPISGKNSLKVRINPANVNYWSVISTDFVPVMGATKYDYKLDVSAADVSQLHSKVYYYDSNKNEIKNDFISQGLDGNFQKELKNDFISPEKTEYVKIQLWVKSNPQKISNYLLDNVEITQSNLAPAFANNFDIFENASPKAQKILVGNKSLEAQIYRTNFSTITDNNWDDWEKIKSEPFSVEPNEKYNYSVTVQAKNISSLRSLIYYLTDDLHEQLSESNNQSDMMRGGRGLTLVPHSEIFTNLDILKPGKYTTALKVKTCQTCTFLKISIGDKINEISLAKNVTEYKWFYHTTYLGKGHHKLKIYSDSNTGLESFVTYSSNAKNNETLNDIFTTKENPAQIIEYEKINPTKYSVKVSSVRPYLLSLAESYDPFWSVYVDGTRTKENSDNFPLYSTVNGFFINKTGEHTLSIEYKPQSYFYMGTVVTLIAIMSIIVGYYIRTKGISLRIHQD